MQLKETTSIEALTNKKSKGRLSLTETLALAATALVGGSAQAQETESDWEFSASSLAYAEPDRVSAVELIFAGDKDYGDSANFNFKVVLDSLTGASATGAIEQNTPQTFTRPSGKGSYQIDANTTPLDDTFKDTRVQINAAWSDALTEEMRYTLGTNLSKEYDYLSISANAEVARDLYQKNTTLSAGLSFGSDDYSPEGNIPLAFSSMVIDQGQFASRDDFWTAFDATRVRSSDSVTTSELLLGWTQVVSRRMLFQVNYGFADKSGYLTDPFKVLSIVDNSGMTQDLVYENRPDSRTQHSLFAMTKYHFEESIFDISYRYLTDDWDIQSHTIDTHWRFYGSDNSFWEPHVRLYQQSAAEFYQPFIADTATIPNFASADYRIGDMTAMTVGLKYGFDLNGGDRAEIRLEYYLQTPKEANQPQGIANLEGLDLYPEVDAVILQFNYYF
jgi:hypothetical protein